MAVHYRSQGLIVGRRNRGESDQLFTIYTKDFGKLEIMGKAVRKTKSKLRGGADLFYLSDIEFIQGKIYKILTDAILIEGFWQIKKDLKRLKTAHKIAEALDSFVPVEEKDGEIFGLLKEAFEKLNSFKKTEIIYYYFFWNLVSLAGYRPKLQKDSLCGKKIDADLAKILKKILEQDWQILSKLKLELSHLKLLKDVSKWYNKHIITYEPR